MTIRYEDVVADLDACRAATCCDSAGCEWEEACRDFSASRRIIRTMSTVQARRPLSAIHRTHAPVRPASFAADRRPARCGGRCAVRRFAGRGPLLAGRGSPVARLPCGQSRQKKRRAEARRRGRESKSPGSELRGDAEEEKTSKRVVDLRVGIAVAQAPDRRWPGTIPRVTPRSKTRAADRGRDVVDAGPDREVLVDVPLQRRGRSSSATPICASSGEDAPVSIGLSCVRSRSTELDVAPRERRAALHGVFQTNWSLATSIPAAGCRTVGPYRPAQS